MVSQHSDGKPYKMEMTTTTMMMVMMIMVMMMMMIQPMVTSWVGSMDTVMMRQLTIEKEQASI